MSDQPNDDNLSPLAKAYLRQMRAELAVINNRRERETETETAPKAQMLAEARGEALREAADDFRQNAARAWGGDASWFTTGSRVAELAADWLTESAEEMSA